MLQTKIPMDTRVSGGNRDRHNPFACLKGALYHMFQPMEANSAAEKVGTYNSPYIRSAVIGTQAPRTKIPFLWPLFLPNMCHLK